MFRIPFFNFKRKTAISPVVLVVLDGFGMAPPSGGNSIELASTPHYDSYLAHYPNGSLIASGEAVGLPTNEVGNTEVGHLTIGAGRVVYQDLKRINLAIENGTFYDNRALLDAISHAKKNKSRIHIMGLVGSGKVHSSIDHLYGLLQFCKKESFTDVFIHAFTDGRDAPPKEGLEIIEKVEQFCDTLGLGTIASVSGRYYSMDRDRRWSRTEKTYKAIIEGVAPTVRSAQEAIQKAYSKGQTDEFIEPTLITDENGPIGLIKDNDVVIFFNFRIDRAKQLTLSIILPEFERLAAFDFGYDPITNKKISYSDIGETFHREKVVKNIFFATMTEYQKNLPVSAILFKSEAIPDSLTVVLSQSSLHQIHMAESEKERFVTYYFDGLREELVPNEEKLIVPSPQVSTYDLQPEMSLRQLVKEFKSKLKKDMYHFFILNFANADMVAHTGNLQAAQVAIEAIDKYLHELVESTLRSNGTVIVTADHGNAEEMLTFPSSTFFYTSESGIVNTDHSNNPVPVVIINNSLFDKQVEIPKGQLSDIAPTVLSLLKLPIPEKMTGSNLLRNLKPEKLEKSTT